ncbi:MAG: addiction module protein [Acidobacteria bacterium]|nr:addiction module protein [Acidobacteriota bacterium]
MSVVADAEELALKLSDSERAKLAEKLIASLPSPFVDGDEDWVEEALRRDKEMDDNPESVMTEEDFFTSLRKYIRL